MSAMNKFSTLKIALGDRSYDIVMGEGLLLRLHEFLPFDLRDRTVFILTDENVSKLHAGAVYEGLKGHGAKSVQMLALPAGEQTKSLAGLEKVLNWLLDHGVTRQSVLFAVGGGVVGDLAGFAASIILRGISYIQVPTTLLAQVDSAVGGKTAIDMLQGKNLVGTFYQPAAVLIDPHVLITLPEREMKAGYAEIVKYGLVNDPEFFIWLEKEGRNVCRGDAAAVIKAVNTSCRKKAEIVEEDEREESGVRALLNLGHTFGHALEAACGYDGRLLHGEAVAIGMTLAFELSFRMGICPETDAFRVRSHLEAIGLPTRIGQITPSPDVSADDLINLMRQDKKVYKGALSFILVNGIGKAHETRDVALQDIKAVLEYSMERK